MKNLFIPVLLALFAVNHVFGQLNFERKIIQLPSKKTTFEAVEIGDVTNDGLSDIVVGSGYYFDNLYDYSVFIYKQNSDGTFAPPVQLKYKVSYPGLTDLEIGDFNNDNLNDIAIAFSDSIGIAFQTTEGGFTPFKGYADINRWCGIKAGDLNNDGLTDIVGYNGAYKIFYQLPAGGFSKSTIPSGNRNCTQMDIGDLNNNGLNDIVKVYENSIEIQYQEAGNGITGNSSLEMQGSFGGSVEGVSIGDVNGDDRNDIVVTYGGNRGKICIFYQTEGGSFNTDDVKVISTYDIPKPVIIADINCDGKKDITIGHSGWNHISVFTQNDTAGLDNYEKFPSIYNYRKFSMAVGDINNDKRPDIVSVGQDATVCIQYNKTAPLSFDSIKFETRNLQVVNEIVDSVSYHFVSNPDTSTVCPRNRCLKYKTIRKFSNDLYSGDSLLIRFGNLCTAYCDTIITPFNYIKSFLIDSDTSYSVVFLDTLEANFNQINSPAYLNMQSINIKANICWEVNIDKDWVTPSINSGKNNHVLELQFAKNARAEDRFAKVTINADHVPPITINIRQYAASPFLNISTSIVVLSEAINNQAFFEIDTNTGWAISKNVEWISLDKTQGLESAIISILCQPNESLSDRSASINISTPYGFIRKELFVYQLKKDISAVDETLEEDLVYYPNPVNDNLYLKWSNHQANYEIVNLQGQVIRNGKLDDDITVVDFSDLTKGVYFIRLYDNQKSITKRILKQ
ncbi:MAG: FG-GAP-like repeat-containing protein [Paludibacter sp.]|nr:FG-GAP-like repeat-containing protein [Paludibacter sp.]